MIYKFAWPHKTAPLSTALLAFVLLLQTAPVQAASNRPIKIGFITSLSGVAADNGRTAKNAIEAYMDEIHHKIAGRDVELIIENDASSPATAIEKIKKLAEQDHVDIIEGFILANTAYAGAPAAERAQVPLLIATAASDDITQRKHYQWVVRSGMTSSGSNYPFGEYAHKTMGYKRVVTIGVDFQYGYEVVAGFQRTFELAGGRVVQKLWVPFGFTDFTSFLKQIDRSADAVFLCTAGKAAELLPRQLRETGIKLPIIAGGTSYDESVLPEMGNEAVGAVTSLRYSAALDTPTNKHFLKAYEAKSGGAEPGYYSESSWTGGMIIKKAIESINGEVEHKDKLMAALKNVQLTDAPCGPIKFDDRGSAIMNYYVRKVTKVNGKLQNSVIHTFPMCSQFWKFNPTDYLKEPLYSRDYPQAGQYCSAAK